MTDLRGNIGWVIGSAVAGIVAFLSWFYQSGLLSTVIGIVIGAGIAYFVQTRTQKRVWKREYAIKIAETVYGPLFQDIDSALPYHSDESVPQGVSFYKWDEIKRTYQYLMIDNDFRDRLDRFSEKTGNFTRRLQDVRRFANSVAIEEARIAFPSFKEVCPEFQIKTDGQEQHHHISESLLRQEHPQTSALREKEERKTPEYFIGLLPVRSGQVSVLEYKDSVKTAFDAMWDRCHQKMEQNLDVQTIRKEYPEIIKEMRSIRKELIRRIQEPWKI